MLPPKPFLIRCTRLPALTRTVCVIVETVVFFISVLVVTYIVQDGKSNYLEGAMLFGLYVIIAVAFYATPSDSLDNGSGLVGSAGALFTLLRLK